jgi:hypothetical protein
MRVKQLYNEIFFPELKTYIETNSIYSPVITKVYTEQSKVFPIVTVQLVRERQIFNNLTYGERTYPFRIDINVYSNDKTVNNTKVSKIVITDEIAGLVEDYFNENYKVSVSRQDDMENIDGNIRRDFIRIEGILDTKWGDEDLMIYPASNY